MRRKRNYKREFEPDLQYGSITITRFINYLMHGGKKSVAEKIMYDAMALVKERTKEEPLPVFEKAFANVTPTLEVSSRRIGGANYQVPREVSTERRFALATRWMINAARAQKGKSMSERLAGEFMAAAKNEGSAIKKKQDTHRMAEANRAFAHFAR